MDENERAPRSVMDAGMSEMFYFDFLPTKFIFTILIIIVISVKLQGNLMV
jgi:hypothetical protein